MNTYLYQCFDASQRLLYVGITRNVERRQREHARDKHWWSDVAKVTTIAFPSRAEAVWAEWAIIATQHPVYNRTLAPPSARTAAGDQPVTYETFPEYVRRWWATNRHVVINGLKPKPQHAFILGTALAVIAVMALIEFTNVFST